MSSVSVDKSILYANDVHLELTEVGADIAVLFYGGHSPHIGGTAIAFPDKDGEISVLSASVNDHKDHELCAMVALLIAKKRGCRCSVTGGIHYDGISKEKIERVCSGVCQMAEELLKG